MIDIMDIGYFLFMESQEQKEREDNDDEEMKNKFAAEQTTIKEKQG